MLFDKENMFSENQAITASAASTNVIDLGAEGADVPTPNEKNVEMNIQVTEAFNNATSVAVKIQSSVDAAFTSPIDEETTPAILLASLVAGYKFKLTKLPEGVKRYVRLYYTVVGTAPTTGKIHAGLVLDRQTNE